MHEGRTPISEALLLNTIKLFLESHQKMISNRIDRLETKMATLSEVQAKQQEAIKATTAAVARVVEDNTAQNAEIQKLKDQLASGIAVTAADLDGLIADNQVVINAMNALDPIPPIVPVP